MKIKNLFHGFRSIYNFFVIRHLIRYLNPFEFKSLIFDLLEEKYTLSNYKYFSLLEYQNEKAYRLSDYGTNYINLFIFHNSNKASRNSFFYCIKDWFEEKTVWNTDKSTTLVITSSKIKKFPYISDNKTTININQITRQILQSPNLYLTYLYPLRKKTNKLRLMFFAFIITVFSSYYLLFGKIENYNKLLTQTEVQLKQQQLNKSLSDIKDLERYVSNLEKRMTFIDSEYTSFIEKESKISELGEKILENKELYEELMTPKKKWYYRLLQQLPGIIFGFFASLLASMFFKRYVELKPLREFKMDKN